MDYYQDTQSRTLIFYLAVYVKAKKKSSTLSSLTLLLNFLSEFGCSFFKWYAQILRRDYVVREYLSFSIRLLYIGGTQTCTLYVVLLYLPTLLYEVSCLPLDVVALPAGTIDPASYRTNQYGESSSRLTPGRPLEASLHAAHPFLACRRDDLALDTGSLFVALVS